MQSFKLFSFSVQIRRYKTKTIQDEFRLQRENTKDEKKTSNQRKK